MDKIYDHKKYESDIYSLWEKKNAFTPKIDKDKKPYTIIMPPPNANDNLHIGHARFVAIEDILIRYKRMRGYSALWLPGADHAGIETQYVFEKHLSKIGKSRFDYDSDSLFEMIWEYVDKNRGNMENQLKALGASCDWSRSTYTLDKDIVNVVYKTFKKLYDDGLVYRGKRIVNYCPRCGTAFSQLEVNYIERDDEIYFLDYGTIQIATTRPETIFADCAIAVNPKDRKYSKLVGKTAYIPIIGKEIPIISDDLVDKDFGTGALKVTPGHDATDFEIGQKHNLEVISVINKKGRMKNVPTQYLGMKAQDARVKVIEDIKKQNKLIKIESIHHTVGVCYRDKGLIEPLVSKQWFIEIKPLAERALSAIENKEVKIVSKRYEKIAIHWLKNLKDWNISRQIVWGIKIPAFKCKSCNKWVITEGENPKLCNFCGGNMLTQDKDTFDTWFSSGQWPFATLKTTKPEDFSYFYPTSVMETAYDILVFWVLRMIMMGVYVTGQVPFETVVIHGLVRDKNGEKISKSKGNVIDPLVMVERYGADALRMGVIWATLVENDISLSEDNIRGQRNFSNKIWNISRFVLSHTPGKQNENLTEDDKKILLDLSTTTEKVTKLMDNYRLNEAAEVLYNFIWNNFSNNYIETAKTHREESQKTLEFVLQQSLKLLHPFMPFLTEAIWQQAKNRFDSDLLISSEWPVNK